MSDTTRMCPCGNCDSTYAQAVRDLMRGPAALSRDQAEETLDSMTKEEA